MSSLGKKSPWGRLARSIGTAGICLKIAPRFAAFANGVGIHADDYDDTQLAVAKDRVYGLLTHPDRAGAARRAGDGRGEGRQRRAT
jgi:hypothetical protein